MFKVVETDPEKPALFIYRRRLWIDSSAPCDKAKTKVHEAAPVISHKQSLIYAIVLNLPLLKLDSVKIVYYLRELQ